MTRARKAFAVISAMLAVETGMNYAYADSPAPPAPPSTSAPTPIPDAGSSGLTLSLNSTRGDVVKWLAYYKGAGYRVSDDHEEYFPAGKIKSFHCKAAKPASTSSKSVVEITIDGVRRSTAALTTKAQTYAP